MTCAIGFDATSNRFWLFWFLWTRVTGESWERVDAPPAVDAGTPPTLSLVERWRTGGGSIHCKDGEVEKQRLEGGSFLPRVLLHVNRGLPKAENISKTWFSVHRNLLILWPKRFSNHLSDINHIYTTPSKSFNRFFLTSARVLWKYCSRILWQYFPNTLAEVSSLLRLKTTSRCQQRRIKFWRRRCL